MILRKKAKKREGYKGSIHLLLRLYYLKTINFTQHFTSDLLKTSTFYSKIGHWVS